MPTGQEYLAVCASDMHEILKTKGDMSCDLGVSLMTYTGTILQTHRLEIVPALIQLRPRKDTVKFRFLPVLVFSETFPKRARETRLK